ncbi:MAG: rRNA pseudouridine synthase [Planctomycetes bacterium]|nr:rRNA pseudouridine synthase [Planctomycetota bacterium]
MTDHIEQTGRVRIQKLLSEAGLASRRAVEQMILDGRITVNGRLVTQLPCFVDPRKDDIRLDSRPVRKRHARNVYLLLNKPRGVVCSQQDAEGRPCAADLVKTDQRVYCLGRLDIESTGLVLLTNDGQLTRNLTAKRAGPASTYMVEVEGLPNDEKIRELAAGMYLDGSRSSPVNVKILERNPMRSLLEIRVVESHNRQVRRMLAFTGHKVRKMHRRGLGSVTDDGLKIGQSRHLAAAEVKGLLAASAANRPAGANRRRGGHGGSRGRYRGER